MSTFVGKITGSGIAVLKGVGTGDFANLLSLRNCRNVSFHQQCSNNSKLKNFFSEIIVLSKVSQKEKDKYHMRSLIRGI